MKKSIILLIISIVALGIPMQAQHLKFMGIPLTGTITQFQSKLTAKGVKYDKALSRELPAGSRAFTGTFAGEKANIFVYYDPSTKIVYRAKAAIGCDTEGICDYKYDELKSMLSSKYMDAYEESGYQEGHESYLYVISQDVGDDLRDLVGTIGIYVSQSDFLYPYEYYLHVDYTDYANSNKNSKSKMKDL